MRPKRPNNPQIKDAARIVDMYLSYTRQLLIKVGSSQNSFDNRAMLHSAVFQMNSALLAYGAELALKQKLSFIDRDSWMLFSNYVQQCNEAKIAPGQNLTEMQTLERDADSWLSRTESLCQQLETTIAVSSAANKSSTVKNSLFASEEIIAQQDESQGQLLGRQKTIDIYQDHIELGKILDEVYGALEEIVKRHRASETEF